MERFSGLVFRKLPGGNFGSQQICGERRFDLEEQVQSITVAVSHRLCDLDIELSSTAVMTTLGHIEQGLFDG